MACLEAFSSFPFLLCLFCQRLDYIINAILGVRNPLLPLMRDIELNHDPAAIKMAKARQNFRRSKLRPAGTKSDHCFLASLLTEFDLKSESDRLMLEQKFGVDLNRIKEA